VSLAGRKRGGLYALEVVVNLLLLRIFAKVNRGFCEAEHPSR